MPGDFSSKKPLQKSASAEKWGGFDYLSDLWYHEYMTQLAVEHLPQNFDTELLFRAALSEQKKLVQEAQEWFDEFVKIYLQEAHYWVLCIHRALMICVLNNNTTQKINLHHRKWGRERVVIYS